MVACLWRVKAYFLNGRRRRIRSLEAVRWTSSSSDRVLRYTRNQARKTAERAKGEGLRLIQSLYIGIRLASRDLSVRRAAVGRRIGVSQVPIPK